MPTTPISAQELEELVEELGLSPFSKISTLIGALYDLEAEEDGELEDDVEEGEDADDIGDEDEDAGEEPD
jgi:hypothetical protein